MVEKLTQPLGKSHFLCLAFFSPKSYNSATIHLNASGHQKDKVLAAPHTLRFMTSKGTYVPTFIYSRIILLSALHGRKLMPGWEVLRGLLLLILRTLPDLILRNNCSSLQKREITKSLTCSLPKRFPPSTKTAHC